MNSLTLYVKAGGRTPVRMIRDVHPFGRDEGTITTDWLEFKEGAPAASAFDVPGGKPYPALSRHRAHDPGTVPAMAMMYTIMTRLSTFLYHSIAPLGTFAEAKCAEGVASQCPSGATVRDHVKRLFA